jgi:hypothetical protein
LFETRLTEYIESRAAWAEKQKALADDFNLFRVMGVEHDEVRHSKLLAWLLDRRIERGTHAQGNLGFRLFLEELKSDLGLESRPYPLDYAEKAYWVACEVSGDKSRVDIEIAAREEFIIHIENKLLSVEGPEQTHHEWNDLRKRRRELGISKVNTHAVFLTVDGSNANNENFRPVGWQRVADVLEQFSRQAEPPDVKLFACHFAKAIRILSISPPIEPKLERINDDREAIPGT